MIDENLIDGDVKRQYKVNLSNNSMGIIDIIYIQEHEISIIELKKEVIIKQDITQLSEYVHQIKNDFPGKTIKGYLVGKNIPEDFKIPLKMRGFEFKKLREDIPLKLKLCDTCRKALNSHDKVCKWCGHDKFML